MHSLTVNNSSLVGLRKPQQEKCMPGTENPAHYPVPVMDLGDKTITITLLNQHSP